MTSPVNQLSIRTNTSEQSNLLENDKFSMYSVISFGAVGDGVTDDTTAIQLTVTTANTNGISYIYFPGGRTYLFQGITLKSNLYFCGDGISSEIVCNGSDDSYPAAFIANEAVTNVVFDGLYFNRNVETTAYLTQESYAIRFRNYAHSYITIKNCTFRATECILDRIENLEITNNKFKDHWYLQTVYPGYGDYTNPINTFYCFYGVAVDKVLIEGNTFNDSWVCFNFSSGGGTHATGNSNRIIIRDNFVDTTADTAMFIRPTGGQTQSVIYDGNIFKNIGKTPIKIEINNDTEGNRFYQCIISNNIIEEFALRTASEGIEIKGALTSTSTKSYQVICNDNSVFCSAGGAVGIGISNTLIVNFSKNNLRNCSYAINYCADVVFDGNSGISEDGTTITMLTVYSLSKGIFTNNVLETNVNQLSSILKFGLKIYLRLVIKVDKVGLMLFPKETFSL